MKPKHIKIFWRIVFALSLLTALAASLPFLWPRLFPSLYATDAYRTYADRPGIDATCLHNFPLDDTLTIDVTILQATDSLGWAVLRRDFSLPDEVIEVQEMTNKRSVNFFLAPKNNYSAPMDTTDICNNDLVTMCVKDRTVMVFDIKNRNQITAIMLYKIRELDI